MEESNQDEIIGPIGEEKNDEEEEAKTEEPEETSSSIVNPTERIPSAPRRIELMDCNSANALMYHYYSLGEYVECRSLIGEVLAKFNGRNEYALNLRGCIARIEGKLDEALDWFMKAYEQSGKNHKYFYEIGRIHFLLGRHSIAVEQLEKAAKVLTGNPKVIYWLARAVYHLPPKNVKGKQLNPVETSRDLLMSSPHISTDVMLVCFLGKLLEELNDIEGSIAAYKKAIELQPDNCDVMVRLGLLYLRTGNTDAGFHQIGQCLAYEPNNSDAILAMGSIMQSYNDHDVALNKYRVASEVCDYNGCLWNNIGVGLMAREKLAASHSAMKKAAFINPLNYKISYNLGVLHETMSLNCSALHYMKLASELSTQNSKIIGAMGVILSHMKDVKNARKAYLKAIEIGAFPSLLLNYSIFEYHQGNMEIAWNTIVNFRKMGKNGQVISNNLNATADMLERVLVTSADKDPREIENPIEVKENS